MRAAIVVQQLCKCCRTCFMFYCMFYFTCDRTFTIKYEVMKSPKLLSLPTPKRSSPVCLSAGYLNKKAVLSQRWPRDAPYIYLENFRDSLTTPTAVFPQIFHGHLFRLTMWICVKKLKSAVLPLPEIICGTQKIGQSMGMTHDVFQKFLMNFCSDGPYKCTCQPDNRG